MSDKKKQVAKPAASTKAAAPKAAAPSSKTPVPESFLKKRKTLLAVREARNKALERRYKKKKTIRKEQFKRAEKYVAEYRTKQHQETMFKRQARANGIYYKSDEPKLAFVVRIRGINRVAPKTKKILELLRLRQIHNGVFVRLNEATRKMLVLVEPYITYGYPSLKTVRQLLYKRGFCKKNHQRVPITDNKLIEQSLSRHNIICIEDLIHEIYTVGPHFKEANNFLWPFKLSSPLGGYNKKRKHFIEGGDYGLREDLINKFVQNMI